jgi:hypothetical protein
MCTRRSRDRARIDRARRRNYRGLTSINAPTCTPTITIGRPVGHRFALSEHLPDSTSTKSACAVGVQDATARNCASGGRYQRHRLCERGAGRWRAAFRGETTTVAAERALPVTGGPPRDLATNMLDASARQLAGLFAAAHRRDATVWRSVFGSNFGSDFGSTNVRTPERAASRGPRGRRCYRPPDRRRARASITQRVTLRGNGAHWCANIKSLSQLTNGSAAVTVCRAG